MIQTIFRKEFRENWRTSHLVVLVAVLFISGIISPILAKYTPDLLKSIPDMPEGLAEMIPDPTLADAVTQYIKNVSQFGALLVVILTMGAMVQEKERGTAAMILVRPVKRAAVVLIKWLVKVVALSLGLLAAGAGCWIYSTILFEPLPVWSFILLNLLLLVFLVVYMTVALLSSTLARSQSVAAAGAFGGLAILLIIGSLPRIGTYLPGQLLTWGEQLVMGKPTPHGWSLLVSLGIVILSLVIACSSFEREEL